MERNRKRRKHKSYSRLLLLVVLLILLVVIMNNTFAKYSSTGLSDATVDVAFFLVEETVISRDIALSQMVPGDTGYTYTFSIANYNDEGKRAEIELEFEIAIRTTTNLPLQYKLYKNDDTTDLFSTIVAAPDDDGMYFKTLEFDTEYFGFTQNEKNIYTLEVSFPDGDKSSNKQGIMDAIEITINARQRKV